MATDSRYKLFVFDSLKVKKMTKKAKPKQGEKGRWLRNGAAAKSGLNKTILASAWGQSKAYLQYKAPGGMGLDSGHGLVDCGLAASIYDHGRTCLGQ